MSDIEKIQGITPNLTKENVDKLLTLFPDVATEITDPATGETERAVDFDALRERLGDVAEGNRERYQFTWPGKREAKRLAREPITKTLRPVKERSKNWDTTKNLYIEGDNLDALKLLRKNYAGMVKLIYIDPPYNTGHDFIYHDDFTKSANEIDNGEYNEFQDQLVANPETNGRFHSDWCSMIYSRLSLAKDLLSSDGALFVSIDDNEESNLIKIMDEIFGAKNRIAIICHKSRASVSNDKIISPNHNFVLFYTKNSSILEEKRKSIGLDPILDNFTYDDNDGRGKYRLVPVDGPGGAKKGNPYYEFLGVHGYWRFSEQTMQEKYKNGLIVKSANSLYQKYYRSDAAKSRRTATTWWDDAGLTSSATTQLKKLMGGPSFDTPKPVELIQRMLQLITNDDKQAKILDFFSGSATTAEAVMKMNSMDGGNRQFIMVQLEEYIPQKNDAYLAGYHTICEIGEERIRRAGEKIKSEIEAENAQLTLDGTPKKVPDIGFRVLRVDDSNYEDRRKNVGTYSQDNLDFDVDITKSDRSDLDLLFEALPKFQLPYDVRIDTLSRSEFDGHTVYSVDNGRLLACFEPDIPESLVRTMAAYKPRPSYVLVSERSLPDSAACTNFVEIFKQSADSKTGSTKPYII